MWCIYILMALVNGHSGGVLLYGSFFQQLLSLYIFRFVVPLRVSFSHPSGAASSSPCCNRRLSSTQLNDSLNARRGEALVRLRGKQSNASGITDIAAMTLTLGGETTFLRPRGTRPFGRGHLSRFTTPAVVADAHATTTQTGLSNFA